MKEPPCTRNEVIIAGAGYGVDDVITYAHLNPDSQVWCVPLAYPRLIDCKHIDLIFETHSPDLWALYINHYATSKLVTLQPTKAIYCLPTSRLIEEFGSIFTSTFAWMIAYAIYCRVPKIALFGIVLDTNEESSQRDAIEFLIGYARANSIEVVISRLSPLYYNTRR
jgi:hypothetical protein